MPDIGARQDLIGKAALANLEDALAEKRLRIIRLGKPFHPAAGIGGRATVVGAALILACLGGVGGVVETTVLREGVSHLLSAGFLAHLGSSIDLEKVEIDFRLPGRTVQLQRAVRSRHSNLSVTNWASRCFPTPPGLQTECLLSAEAFNLDRPLERLSQWGDSYVSGPAGVSCA